MIRKISIWGIILLFFMGGFLHGQEDPWLTYYERSGYKRTPRYAETIAFCQRLAQASPWVRYTRFGVSPQGRDLPLVIVSKDGEFTPEQIRHSDKVVVLVQAGIHAGEIDGKDAGLMLIRDLAIRHKMPQLLERAILLFIPIFNVDGHERFGPYNRINQNGPEEMGWRVTAQNLNLNRDFLKADCPEIQAWLRVFNRYRPDLLMDIHVTDGADYQYVLTYGLETGVNVATPLREFNRQVLQPFLNLKMAEDGFPLSPYVALRDRNDLKRGLVNWVASPRFSNGYGAVQNRTFYLVENHMLKDYRTRVTATYHFLIHFLEAANRYAERIKQVVREADRLTAKELPGHYLPLNFRTSFQDSTMINFLGVDYERIPSEISGSDWLVYHPDRLRLFRIPFFYRSVVTDSVRVPYVYLIPREWQLLLDRLALHGVVIHRLKRDTTLQVKSYRFKNVHWREQPYEGRHPVRFQTKEIEEERSYPAGTAVVFLNQRTNRVIVHLLEPRAPDSFVHWGFLDAIFEQKEYAEPRVLERLARQMLRNDPALAEEFRHKLETDSTFAHSPRERLYFFYRRSPYWDHKINLYPIGKIEHPVHLDVE